MRRIARDAGGVERSLRATRERTTTPRKIDEAVVTENSLSSFILKVATVVTQTSF